MIFVWGGWLAGCPATSTSTPTGTDSVTDADTDTDADSDADTDADTDTDTDTDVDTAPTGDTGTKKVVFTVSSADLAAHAAAPCLQQLPTEFWCLGQGGDNLNPEITWEGAPKGTVSFALTMEDASINFLDHWGVYNIDASATSIPQAASGTNPTASMPKGAEQLNPYAGSCSNGMNTYRWRLFALDATIDTNIDQISDIDQFAQTHTLAVATMCHCPAGNCLAY